ncbi:ornithine decarboxylase-like [Amphiura filiformis]|uniref:ornithine decarboxylase-like n=1 Tax=Amphiura filiformis TaxID=82378 RepID=UPI003B21AF8E
MDDDTHVDNSSSGVIDEHEEETPADNAQHQTTRSSRKPKSRKTKTNGELGPSWKEGCYGRGLGKRAFIKKLIEEQKTREDQDDSFMLFDLGDVFKKWRKWKKAMPRVTPFYAVKCNPDESVLRLLSALNCGFDCASKGELQFLRETIGVHPERIINANTWKQCSHLEYARKRGVKMMTFDCEEELDKVKKIYPEAELVLRLSIYDPTADLPFE